MFNPPINIPYNSYNYIENKTTVRCQHGIMSFTDLNMKKSLTSSNFDEHTVHVAMLANLMRPTLYLLLFQCLRYVFVYGWGKCYQRKYESTQAVTLRANVNTLWEPSSIATPGRYTFYSTYTTLLLHTSLRWRQNECDGVLNNHPHECLLNRLLRRRSKKTSPLRVTGLC